MKMIKIIGLYSPFGSDQCGYHAINYLKRNLSNSKNISFLALDRPGIKLIEIIKNSDLVILVDAVISNQEEGQIVRFEDNNFCNIIRNLSSHQLGILDTLNIAETLNMLPKKLVFYGIEINESYSGSTISNKIGQGICELSKRIELEIKGKE